MLLELSIKNVALIESLRLSLSPGLTVLTGETGAGKSILIDAIGFVLGGRADREMIRSSADRAQVDAIFDVPEHLLALLGELGYAPEDGLLPVSREFAASGRGMCRIAGSLATLSQLKEITAHLVDMHGQHEHQFLLEDARHLRFLDGFAGNDLVIIKHEVAAAYSAHREIVRQMEAEAGTPEERERQIDMLRYQIDEITAAKLKPGEDEKLASRRVVLRNASKITSALDDAYGLMYAGKNRQLSAIEALSQAMTALDGIADLEEDFKTCAARVREAYYLAEDASERLRSIRSDREGVDPGEAERVENRIDEINRIKRKYGADISSVIQFCENAKEKLDALEGGEERQRKLALERAKRFERLCAACARLTTARVAYARSFEKKVLGQLQDLGMPRARFEVEIISTENAKDGDASVSADGWDKVRFLIAVNAGEPLKALSRTASGGEMSRIMLALKSIGAQNSDVSTLIFDEIDTGISGRMAHVVGEKMAQIGLDRQVLCVTHSPQIAALGDHHLLVEKKTIGERTGTHVRTLDDEGRVLEIARLVGGSDDVTASAREHAGEMLKAARKIKGENA